MNKLEKAAKNFVQEITDIETFGWPPVCYGIIHQPERPMAKRGKETNEISDTAE